MNIVYQTAKINTPAIIATSTALASNPARNGWSIQNLGTNVLFVRLGTGATTSVFHYCVKGGGGNDDGTGGSVSQTDGVVFTGEISIAGTSPRYVVMEM
jgi:hypothetical protein